VGLSPLGTAATSGLLYKPQMIDEGDCGAIGGMKIGRGKPKYSEKTCATLSTTNPTLPDPGSDPGRRGGKPATNRLSYGAAWPTVGAPFLSATLLCCVAPLLWLLHVLWWFSPCTEYLPISSGFPPLVTERACMWECRERLFDGSRRTWVAYVWDSNFSGELSGLAGLLRYW
jgi:hypothetical protein